MFPPLLLGPGCLIVNNSHIFFSSQCGRRATATKSDPTACRIPCGCHPVQRSGGEEMHKKGTRVMGLVACHCVNVAGFETSHTNGEFSTVTVMVSPKRSILSVHLYMRPYQA